MIAPLATVLLAASSALAAGAGAACSGGTSLDTLGGNFDLVAVTTTSPPETYGLVLAPVLALPNTNLRTLATNASYVTKEPTTFSLMKGGLHGSGLRVSSQGVPPGIDAPINFEVGSDDALSEYCALLSTGMGGSSDPTLSVRGNATGFNLCEGFNVAQKLKLDYLIYNPDEDGRQYDFYTCREVTVHLVPHTGTASPVTESQSTSSPWQDTWVSYVRESIAKLPDGDELL